MKIRTGELRHYVDVKTEGTVTIGTRGQEEVTYVTRYEKVPARIRDLTGREAEIAKQYVATATTEIVMRYHDLEHKDFILFNTRQFNIGHIDNIDNRNLWVKLICTEQRG